MGTTGIQYIRPLGQEEQELVWKDILHIVRKTKSKTYSTTSAALRHKMHTSGWIIFIRNLNTFVYGHQRRPIYSPFGYGEEQELVCD